MNTLLLRATVRTLAVLTTLIVVLLVGDNALAQSSVHVVVPGESLSAIAKQYDTDVSTLIRINKLANANVIRVGQKLTLPSGAVARLTANGTVIPVSPALDFPTRIHVVKPGQTLSTLATLYRTTPALLAEINRRSVSTTLHVGEPLRVPEAADREFETQQGNDIPLAGKYYMHVVQPSESLAAVAEEYGTTLKRIVDVNNIGDMSTVQPGMRLIVPPPSFAELFAETPIGEEGVPEYPIIPTTEKWISVDLDHQRAYAWEGDKLIEKFAISSGKARTPTVTGDFRIWAKVPAQTMEGGSRAAGDYYNLPNVQWVQYFYRDYSFHGTYWHNNFGVPMSHGCVNMTNADAKWLYEWANPYFEDHKWHILDASTPGTLVIVHR